MDASKESVHKDGDPKDKEIRNSPVLRPSTAEICMIDDETVRCDKTRIDTEIVKTESEKPNSEAKASAETDQQNDTYLRGVKLVLFTITLMLGQFLTGIDGTVISMCITLFVKPPEVS